MASQLRLHWEAQPQGISRRDRHGCWYDAYLPDTLTGWDPSIPADVGADIADAESAIRRLNSAGIAHVSLEGLARFLLRAESVGSSKIEGLDVAAMRLARAEAALSLGGDANDRVAVEVIGNIAAMQDAIDGATAVDPPSSHGQFAHATGRGRHSRASELDRWQLLQSVLSRIRSPSALPHSDAAR